MSRTEKLRESVKLSDDGDEDYGEELVFFLLPDFTPECSGSISIHWMPSSFVLGVRFGQIFTSVYYVYSLITSSST